MNVAVSPGGSPIRQRMAPSSFATEVPTAQLSVDQSGWACRVPRQALQGFDDVDGMLGESAVRHLERRAISWLFDSFRQDGRCGRCRCCS